MNDSAVYYLSPTLENKKTPLHLGFKYIGFHTDTQRLR